MSPHTAPAPVTDLPEFFGTDAAEAVARDRRIRREVLNDILAAARLGDAESTSASPGKTHLDPFLFLTRPTILRRLAGLLGDRIPTLADRLVAGESPAVPLATALSLETGLPFVVLSGGQDERPVLGGLYPGERVVVIQAIASTGRAATAAAFLANQGVEVLSTLAALDSEHAVAQTTAGAGHTFEALFGAGQTDVEE